MPHNCKNPESFSFRNFSDGQSSLAVISNFCIFSKAFHVPNRNGRNFLFFHTVGFVLVIRAVSVWWRGCWCRMRNGQLTYSGSLRKIPCVYSSREWGCCGRRRWRVDVMLFLVEVVGRVIRSVG